MKLPKIMEVERLTLKPGDVLFVHVEGVLSPQTAQLVKERIRAELGGPPDVKIVLLGQGMTVKVAEGL